MKPGYLAILAALALPTAAWAKKPEGPTWCRGKELPAAIEGTAFPTDGDTLGMPGQPASIRLWGMNTPEQRDAARTESVAGMRARAFVADLLAEAGHKVHCEPVTWDKFCRIVAVCTTAKGADISRATLSAGYAYGFHLWSATPEQMSRAVSYSEAEAAARKARAGLWPYWLGEAAPGVERAAQRP